MIHKSERYAWIPVTIVMLMLWGLGAKAGFNVSAERQLQATGRDLSADVLSFGGIVFGSFNGVRAPVHEARVPELMSAASSGPLWPQTIIVACPQMYLRGRFSR